MENKENVVDQLARWQYTQKKDSVKKKPELELVWLIAGLLLGYLLFHGSATYYDYSSEAPDTDGEMGQWGE